MPSHNYGINEYRNNVTIIANVKNDTSNTKLFLIAIFFFYRKQSKNDEIYLDSRIIEIVCTSHSVEHVTQISYPWYVCHKV